MQGCGAPNKPYIKKDTPEPQPLKVARYETPPFRTYTTGGMIASIVVSGVLLGVIGAGLGYGIHHAVSIEADDPTRPDFGKLIADTFIERAKNEIPGWPHMMVEEKTIKEPLQDKTCNVLEIQVDDTRVEMSSNTLITYTIITMKDKESNVLWQKGYAYDSSWFQRFYTVDALKADNYKQLKAEYAFAANKTVDDFIAHFKHASFAGTVPEGGATPSVTPPVPPVGTTQQDKATAPPIEKPAAPPVTGEQQIKETPVERPAAPPVGADHRFSNIKAIVLTNGTIIEGQVISMDPDIVKIRTKDGEILSYSFKKDVQRLITE
jgi:hypothetical protein